MPSLDCLLTVHNNEKTLPQCLDSILGQSQADFRLLIYDDASDDASPQILQLAEQKDPRIEIITAQEYRGEAYAFNQLAKKAKSPYIALHRATDTSEPTRFEKQIERLKNSSLIALGCALYLDEKMTEGSVEKITFSSNPKDVLMQQIFSQSHLGLAIGTCMYKKEALKKKAPFMETVPQHFDAIFHIQLQQRYPLRLASLQEALVTIHALPQDAPSLLAGKPSEYSLRDLIIQLLQVKEIYFDNILITSGFLPY